MALDLITLGGSTDEVAAARLLRGHAHMRIAPEAPEQRASLGDGFVAAPESWECLIELPLDQGQLSRRFRRALGASVAAWDRLGCELAVYDVASFGRERLIEELYFPIFVRNYYARGLSPYGSHRLDAFQRLARDDRFVAVVEVAGRARGGALLSPRVASGSVAVARGAAPAGTLVEGLAYALGDELADVRRAFVLGLAASFSRLGFDWLSLGRDAPFVEARYTDVTLEKLRWADSVCAWIADPVPLYHWAPGAFGPGEGIAFVGLDGEQLAVCAHGRPPPRYDQLERALTGARILAESPR